MLITKIDDTTKVHTAFEKREAVRSIIRDNNKVLLIYIDRHDTYIFPGGGVEDNESLEETCIRETLEEAGAVVKILNYVGYIDEQRDSKLMDGMYSLISHYYECEVIEMTKQKLLPYEEEYGFIPTWIDIDEAYAHNMSKVASGTERYLERCTKLLKLMSNGEI